MTSKAAEVGSKRWSCATLQDGIDQILADAHQNDEQVENMEKLIKDCAFWVNGVLY